MKNLRLNKVVAGAFIMTAVSGACFGHAFPDHSDPKVGAEVKAAPAQVRIWFDEELEGKDSTMQVFDEAGKEVDKMDCHVDKDDKTLMSVTLPEKLGPGTYKVVWKAVTDDTHTTHGDFKFVVKGP